MKQRVNTLTKPVQNCMVKRPPQTGDKFTFLINLTYVLGIYKITSVNHVIIADSDIVVTCIFHINYNTSQFVIFIS